jgi:hypothetical protein
MVPRAPCRPTTLSDEQISISFREQMHYHAPCIGKVPIMLQVQLDGDGKLCRSEPAEIGFLIERRRMVPSRFQ